MATLTFILVWLLVGMLSSAYLCLKDDITSSNVLIVLVVGMTGPVVLFLLALYIFFEWLDKWEKSGKVLIKRFK